MNKRLLPAFMLGLVIFLGLTWPTRAVEKLTFGTPIKFAPAYYLPVLAAEEKGFWKENRLEVEWVPVGTTIAHHHAITAGSIRVGMDTGVGMVPGIARGVPAILVASVQNYLSSALYVRADSPVKEPKGLKKGARVGVVSLGGHDHAFGRVLLRPFGLEKEVRFVATGGIPASMAALKAGAVDATAMSWPLMVPLEVKGEVQAVTRLEDHFRTELTHTNVYARKDYVNSAPEVISRVIKAILQGAAFTRENPKWAQEKIAEVQGVPPAAAEAIYKKLDFSKDGKINRQAVENLRNFLIDFEILPKDRAPAVDELYTTQFTG